MKHSLRALGKSPAFTAIAVLTLAVGKSVAQPRFTAFLLGGLAAAALLLAMVGIYGVIAYTVTERTQEMGIRIALGANRADILRLVLRQWMFTTTVEISIGLAASFALTRLMSTLLYHMSVTDPFIFAIGPCMFLCIAAVASLIPANRATHVDPAVTLR